MMDKERRTRLRRVVGEARKLIEDEVRAQLRRLGIDGGGMVKPIIELPHLGKENVETREKALKAIEKEKVGGISQREAYDRYIAHVGFTYINRLAAIRAMETRGLIKETIKRRDKYGGRSRREYEIAERGGIYDPYELLRVSLLEAFNEVSAEIKVLFDINSEYCLIFPGHRTLKELIRFISEEIPEEDWKEDDIIGWIYQYYNEEARRKFRAAKRKPTPDDIPIISQFYTPHWIVKCLVDNTLGRLWQEFKPNSQIKEFCTYLVPLGNEAPKRDRKRARELKVLDPACGSGHFLNYAFDVLYRIYLEDEPDTPREEIPALILENNIFGIDIDLRAVQLAALSLYLKTKFYNPTLKITKLNIVCADAHIADGEKRKAFLQRFEHDPALQQIFARIFEDLNNTNELGSLLRVRGPFGKLFQERKKVAQARFAVEGDISQFIPTGKGGFPRTRLTSSKENNSSMIIPKQLTIEEMLKELGELERECMEKQDMGSLLFATETKKSVGLLSLLSQKYDIVLMNPPHGRVLSNIKEYVRNYYPRTDQDYYAAFVEQAIELCGTAGLIGAVTGRALLVTKSFQKLREEVFKENALPQIVLDLGFKTLEEAHARFAALVLDTKDVHLRVNNHQISFFDLTSFEWDDKRLAFEKCLKTYPSSDFVYEVSIKELSELPGTAYAYWAPKVLRKIFTKFPPLDRDVAKKPNEEKIADVKQGLATADKIRFTRYYWEVPSKEIAITLHETFKRKKWAPFADEFYLFYFYADVPVVVNWKNGGEEIKNFANSVVRNKSFYFRSGMTWSANLQRTQLPRLWEIQRLPFRIYPEGCIFGVGAQAVILGSEKAWTIMGYMVSRLIFAISRLITSENKQGTAATASLPVAFPFEKFDKISSLTKEAHDLIREQTMGDETSTLFIKPWLLQVLHSFNPGEKPITGHPLAEQFEWANWDSLKQIRLIVGSPDMPLRELAMLCIKRKEMVDKRVEELQDFIDEEVYRIYKISDKDRRLIEKELTLRRGEAVLGETEESEEEETEGVEAERRFDIKKKVKDHVARLVSFYIRKTIESDRDGIVPLHELVQGVREHLANDFGEDQADAKEKEMEEILGRSLEGWIVADYFDFHVNLYKRRPIFWHLTSSNLAGGRGFGGAFDCFLCYHKLDRDTIPKIKMNYLQVELERAKWRVDRMRRELQEARDSNDKQRERRLSKEFEQAQSIFEELESFGKALEEVHNPRRDKTRLDKDARWVDKAITEVRDNGYNPIIDYGVRVNIEPFKEAGLLHRAAERVK